MDSKPERTSEAIWSLPDEQFFKEGACHAFALELAAAFNNADRTTDFYYLLASGGHNVAAHILVRDAQGYFDVDFGPQSEPEVITRWADKTSGELSLVKNPGWISSKSELSDHESCLGLHIEAEWLAKARSRAKNYINHHKRDFGL